MNENNKILDLANRLESMLRSYLNCNYNDFGVKANDNLTKYDWKSPIYLALGHKYACSGNNPDVKDEINDFIGNTLIGKSIEDIVTNYQQYAFSSEKEAYCCVEKIILQLNSILTKL